MMRLVIKEKGGQRLSRKGDSVASELANKLEDFADDEVRNLVLMGYGPEEACECMLKALEDVKELLPAHWIQDEEDFSESEDF